MTAQMPRDRATGVMLQAQACLVHVQRAAEMVQAYNPLHLGPTSAVQSCLPTRSATPHQHPCGDARPDSVVLPVQANAEKLRLEKKQRAARQAADRGDPIKPRWFKANPSKQDVDDLAFVYNGGYFESRERHNYEVRPAP